jgi:hypothetical protein
MKSQMLDHACRPAPLRARQKAALSATERDCFASHPKPKRFAVRGCASPGCFARRRLPPTAKDEYRGDRMLPLIAANWRTQTCHQMKCPMSSIFRLHALPLSLRRKILSRDSGAFQSDLSRIRANNSPQFSQDCAIHPPRIGYVRRVSVALLSPIRFSICGHSVFSIHARSVRKAYQCLQRAAPPKSDQTVCVSKVRPSLKKHLAFAQNRVGRLLESSPFAAAYKRLRVFLFASRVAFRASSNPRPNLCFRVVQSGVAGRVSGLMSSRAGRAHRDCLPLFTAPKQSHDACFAVLCGSPHLTGRSCACFVQQLSLIRISSRIHARSSHVPNVESSEIEME